MGIPEVKDVFTPLGKGRIVHTLPNGTLVVEFPHGGGQIFCKEEIYFGGDLLRAAQRTAGKPGGVRK